MIRKGNAGILIPPERVLLIQLGDIGDIVLSFPCARALRERFPQAHITMAVRPKAGDLTTCSPHVDETLWVDDQKKPFKERLSSQFSFFKKLRRRRYDLVIDLKTGTRGALLGYLSGAPRLAGFFTTSEPFWRNWLFTDLASPFEPENNHISHYYSNLLKDFGFTITYPWPEMRVPDDVARRIARRLSHHGAKDNRPLVAIQPFSLWRYKEWGDEKFIALSREIVAATKGTIVLVGSPEEQQRAEAMALQSSKGVFSWAGKTTLAELAGLLARSDLFIGVDSAGMHVAAALGTATVTIFGPSSASDWAPRGDIHTSVTPDWPCTPCFQKGCRNSGISECLLGLPVGTVFEAVLRRLGKSRKDEII